MAPLRIACWSGPRNISTALLRAWEHRPDTVVVDEPLYAHYLRETGAPHPGAAEVIAQHEPDWQRVVERLLGPVTGPDGQSRDVLYQKHMAHHLLPGMGRDWLDSMTHVILIRDPREMLLSLQRVTPEPSYEDTGLPQQLELVEALRACAGGAAPPIIDARDVLEDPRGRLTDLCTTLGLAFREEMLSWPAGRRATDGVWAKHWYASVEASTEFQAWRPRTGQLPTALEPVLERCQETYDTLYAARRRN